MSKSFRQSQVPADCCRVTFEPMGVSGQAEIEKTIMQVATAQHIDIRSDCGGEGRCGKCLVGVSPLENLSPLSQRESELLTTQQIQSGFRLACQARIRGPVRVFVPLSARDTREATGKDAVAGTFSRNPLVKRMVLRAPTRAQLKTSSPCDFVDLVEDKAKETFTDPIAFNDPESVRMLSRLQSVPKDMTLVNHVQKGITAVLSGRRTRSLGIALDIGTTTLASYLCDFGTGNIIATASSANPQRRFGEDVISRIAYTNGDDSGLALLQKTVVDEINTLMGACVHKAGAGLQDIDEVTVVGNTTMQQIFMGFHPYGLGVSPYLPVSLKPHDFRAKDLGMQLNPAVNVHVFPVISGFVGGDTVGVILSERPHESDELTLIVDIGTNGELVLGNRNGLWATSCATGPALEGAHVHCGMRATAGAIAKVSIDPADYRVGYEVIGGKLSPQGICGSGIIDAIAGMLAAGLILPSGRIREGMPGVIVDERGIGRRFMLASSQGSAAARDIFISLDDIRQVQLAKSALYIGVKFLMRKAGVDHFDRLVLTGAFGARFNWEHAVTIGMLPEAARQAELKIVENAAGQGAIMALLDGGLRRQIYGTAQTVHVLELAEEPDFVEEFSAATMFSDSKLFSAAKPF